MFNYFQHSPLAKIILSKGTLPEWMLKSNYKLLSLYSVHPNTNKKSPKALLKSLDVNAIPPLALFDVARASVFCGLSPLNPMVK